MGQHSWIALPGCLGRRGKSDGGAESQYTHDSCLHFEAIWEELSQGWSFPCCLITAIQSQIPVLKIMSKFLYS